MKPAPGCIHEDGGRRVLLAFHDREQEECARCVLEERDRLRAAALEIIIDGCGCPDCDRLRAAMGEEVRR